MGVLQDTVPDVTGPVVGVPRALLFHEYEAFLNAFFRALRVPVVTSPPTSTGILDAGTKLCNDECCLPVKVFFGHVASLAGKCESILVPRVVSVARREYTCPKLLGLPDMVREQVRAAGQKIIDVTVDMYRSRTDLVRAAAEVAQQVGRQPAQAVWALVRAMKAGATRRLWVDAGMLPDHAGLAVGLLGHSYLVHDSCLNLRLDAHLKKAGVTQVITEDAMDPRAMDRQAATLPKPLFWTYEKATVGGALLLLKHRRMDGIIQLASFGCGPDSMVSSIIEWHCRKARTPYMLLTLDEHTGEAGLRTRVEAFVDMLEWRKR
jgi:predicted nucleotide-binding protein (sugar kinase/HSP70/actin superfamily)